MRISRLKGIRIYLVAVALLLPALLWATFHWAGEYALQGRVDSTRESLALQRRNLLDVLNSHAFLPDLLARSESISALLRMPDDRHVLAQAEDYMRDFRSISQATAVYILDLKGTLIAAGGAEAELPFTDEGHKVRPYFENALAGLKDKYISLSRASAGPSIYFFSPVIDEAGDNTLGVAVVQVDTAELEKSWRRGEELVMVSDLDGVVLLASREDYRFSIVDKPSDAQLARNIKAGKYGSHTLFLLPVADRRRLAQGTDLLTVGTDLREARRFVATSSVIPGTEWIMHVYIGADDIPDIAMRYVTIALLIVASLAFFTLVLLQRSENRLQQERHAERERQLLIESEAKLRKAHGQLEDKVAERTSELTAANVRLQQEIEERTRAEQDLTMVQAELVQAAKMAVLGQMAAGVTHEINQPLSAIMTYSENALKLMQLGDYDRLPLNLEKISALVNRMANITNQLKTFSRKSNGLIVKVSLKEAVDEILSLLDSRLKKEDVTVSWEKITERDTVKGDLTRLEQVIMNLVTNAIEAVKDQDKRHIWVDLEHEPDTVILRVRDSGPGLDENIKERIFDPFFTTKEAGNGLGLGLSITNSIVESFGGHIRAENAAAGEGAVFTLQFPYYR